MLVKNVSAPDQMNVFYDLLSKDRVCSMVGSGYLQSGILPHETVI